nr:hypothetical transcript [Hymenolepis microstoma]
MADWHIDNPHCITVIINSTRYHITLKGGGHIRKKLQFEKFKSAFLLDCHLEYCMQPKSPLILKRKNWLCFTGVLRFTQKFFLPYHSIIAGLYCKNLTSVDIALLLVA